MFTDPKTTIAAIILAISTILNVLFKFVIPEETIAAITNVLCWVAITFGLWKAKDSTTPTTGG